MDEFNRNKISLRSTTVQHHSRRTERFERKCDLICLGCDSIGTKIIGNVTISFHTYFSCRGKIRIDEEPKNIYQEPPTRSHVDYGVRLSSRATHQGLSHSLASHSIRLSENCIIFRKKNTICFYEPSLAN